MIEQLQMKRDLLLEYRQDLSPEQRGIFKTTFFRSENDAEELIGKFRAVNELHAKYKAAGFVDGVKFSILDQYAPSE